MSLDSNAVATALRLLNKYGKQITYTHVTAGIYNPATGSATATTSAITPKVYVDVFTGDKFWSNLIVAGDRKVLAAGDSFTTVPKPGDTLTIGAVIFTVLAVKPLYSGNSVALYEIAARL